jgi:hypothetical protein
MTSSRTGEARLNGVFVAVGFGFGLEWLFLFALFLAYVLEARLPRPSSRAWGRGVEHQQALTRTVGPHRTPLPTDSAA